MADLEERVVALEQLVPSIKTNNAQTAEMYETFSAVKGGFKVIEIVGRVAKPLMYAAAIIGAVVIYWKTGKWEAPPLP